MTSDGQLYAPQRFKEITKEKYLISKHSHTSYTDLDKVSPTERAYLLEFIYNELKAEQDAIEEARRNKS